jgi:hypothetical protein
MLAICAFCSLSLAPASAEAQDFDNSGVIALHGAGLGDDVLLAKIEGLPCSYDVSTKALIELARAGVSDRVIAAMVDRCIGSAKAQGASSSTSSPSAKRSAGIYMDFATGDLFDIRQVRPTVASAGKITGNGSILFPFTAKLALAGPSARTVAPDRQPEFYFYFEAADRRVSDFGVSPSEAAQSPSEFTLTKFKVKNNQREMVIGKSNMFDTNIGLDSKNAVPFAIEEIEDSVFKVNVQGALEPGEYGFILKFGGDSYRVFDFTVQ